MGKVTADKFANVAFADITQSAINTLGLEPVRFAVGIFQGVGLIIHRILYYPTSATARQVVGATDNISFGLTTTDAITAIDDITQPSIIDRHTLLGVGVNVEPVKIPFITDWTQLPGGGRILPANPIYLALDSGGLATVGRCSRRISRSYSSPSHSRLGERRGSDEKGRGGCA